MKMNDERPREIKLGWRSKYNTGQGYQEGPDLKMRSSCWICPGPPYTESDFLGENMQGCGKPECTLESHKGGCLPLLAGQFDNVK